MSSGKSNMSRPKKNEAQDVGVELEVDQLAALGRGLGRRDGIVWFVPGAVPGDRVLAAAVHSRPRYVEGRLSQILRSSTDRRDPPCRLQGECGGCPLMPLAEERQVEWRRRFVVDALERIGGVETPPVEAVHPASAALGYRNRVELVLGASGADGRPVLGLHAVADPSAIVDVDRCLLQSDPANAVLATIRATLGVRGGFGSSRASRGAYRVVIRRSDGTGEMLVALREVGPRLEGVTELARAIRTAHPEVVGVVRLRALSARRGGATTEVVSGRGWIEERVAGLTFRLPAATFVQVSAAAATELARLVREMIGLGAAELLDLYGGVGVHALVARASGLVERAVCVDADRSAVDCGTETARRSQLAVRFERADVGRYLAHAPGRPEVVVANPPRAGMGRDVTAALRALDPRRIVLVSCDATTLARDLRRLLDGGRFRLERVVPVDVFPQTAHVETVSLLTR
jgi:23S rRNA (uracil1939-C5)-methyltransferase